MSWQARTSVGHLKVCSTERSLIRKDLLLGPRERPTFHDGGGSDQINHEMSHLLDEPPLSTHAHGDCSGGCRKPTKAPAAGLIVPGKTTLGGRLCGTDTGARMGLWSHIERTHHTARRNTVQTDMRLKHPRGPLRHHPNS